MVLCFTLGGSTEPPEPPEPPLDLFQNECLETFKAKQTYACRLFVSRVSTPQTYTFRNFSGTF